MLSKIIEKIPDSDLKGVSISSAKCIPQGRARYGISPDDFLYDKFDYGGCHSILFLTIRQDGSVYPCCAGSDLTTLLCLGNANKEPLSEIIARAQVDPILNILFYQGPKYLSEILSEQGSKDLTCNNYTNICHLCYELFMDNTIANDMRRVLSNYFSKKEAEYRKSINVNF